MNLIRCSKEAYARCGLREQCGPLEEACFAQGSECDKYNETIAALLEYRESLRKEAEHDSEESNPIT